MGCSKINACEEKYEYWSGHLLVGLATSPLPQTPNGLKNIIDRVDQVNQRL
jgi:hypothetical protein